MIKYFIERPDGSWLTDPERWFEGEPAFTNDPFKAWMFDNHYKYETLEKGGGHWSLHNAWSSLPDRDTQITSFEIWDEDLLPGIKITKQEFENRPYTKKLVHIRKIYGCIDSIIDQEEDGTIIKNSGGYSMEVYHPVWHGPLENFFKASDKPTPESYSYIIIDPSK